MKARRPARKHLAHPATRHEHDRKQPEIRFSPYAWAKLHYFCHRGQTEIGGFGITAAEDPLRIEDFVTVRQQVSLASVAFDDQAVAGFFDDQVDAGRQPVQFARCWCHTHPGDSPYPSGVDEQTFARVFGGCDWAVMLILAKGGETYARLRFNVGPGGESVVPVCVDYDLPFAGSDREAWEAEYQANIKIEEDPIQWSVLGSVLEDDPFDIALDPLSADLLDDDQHMHGNFLVEQGLL